MIGNILFQQFQLTKLYLILIFILLNKILDNYHHKNIHKIINNRITTTITNFNKSINNSSEKNSKRYWENRYSKGGNSGAGSYNHLAKFKASILNSFVAKNHINTVIEFGSGDCNQLSLANYKSYIGYDVSQTAISICKKKFKNDKTKIFIHLDNNFNNNKKADLSISLEVIFHLIEDEVFNEYMQNLFISSNKYVCIYSSNFNKKSARYVRHRKFTDWIDKYMFKNWKMKEFIPNKYPFDTKHKYSTSYSDFYFYEKIN